MTRKPGRRLQKSLDQPHTADAEQLEVTFGGEDGETLIVTFKDWREQSCSVTFRRVLAFRWLASDALASRGLNEDQSYELFHSELMRTACSSTSAEFTQETYRHYCLGFNVRSAFLDVVATEMTVSQKS